MKQAVLTQIARPLDMDQRPFLSTSIDLDSLLAYGDRMPPSQMGKSARKVIARIDLMALWLFDKLTEHSFANISSSKEFNQYFEDKDTDIHICKTGSVRLREFLLGARGPWWVDCAVLITPADAVLEFQVGGHQNTIFGAGLRQIYELYTA